MAKELDTKPDSRAGPRFHIREKLGNGSEMRLPPDAAHHAGRVLRLEVGDAVALFDGRGGEFDARVTRMERGDVWVKTGAHRSIERESKLQVVLVQGLSSGDRMDFTVQKAVELGVSAIQPVAMERSVVKLRDERASRRVEHWQNLVISACEQSGRNQVPQVAPVLEFRQWIAQLPDAVETRLLMSPAALVSLREFAPAPQQVLLLAGPEGGLSPVENEVAQSRAFKPVRLGPRVLRTETAAIAALAAMQALWGDF